MLDFGPKRRVETKMKLFSKSGGGFESLALAALAALASLAASALLASSPALAASADGLAERWRIGVAPHTSARVIVEQYQPVRAALEKGLGGKAEIVTAPDFTEFVRRALAGDYDVAITTGHQAQMLAADKGWIPLVTYKADFRSVIVSAAGSPKIERPSQLDGRPVAGLGASSLVTIWGMHWIQDAGAKPEMRFVSAADSEARMIVAGEAVAGLMSQANFDKLPEDIRSKLRVDVSSPPMAGRVYLLSPSRADKAKAVLGVLESFSATPDAAAYFEANRLGGYRRVDPEELGAMDRYADEVRAELSKGASK